MSSLVYESAFCCSDKTPESNQLKGERADLFSVSEVSVHGHMVLLLHGETEYHGRSMWWSKVAHIMVTGKQREKERGRGWG
jgi:hypothetical protein